MKIVSCSPVSLSPLLSLLSNLTSFSPLWAPLPPLLDSISLNINAYLEGALFSNISTWVMALNGHNLRLNLSTSQRTGTLSLSHPLLFQPLSILKHEHSSTTSAYDLISTRCQHSRFDRVKTRRNWRWASSTSPPLFVFLLLLICSPPFLAVPDLHHFPSSSIIIRTLLL